MEINKKLAAATRFIRNVVHEINADHDPSAEISGMYQFKVIDFNLTDLLPILWRNASTEKIELYGYIITHDGDTITFQLTELRD